MTDALIDLAALARIDATVAITVTALFAAIELWRRRRPLTSRRVMDVALPAILLVMLGLRYTALAAVTLAAPQQVLGAGTSEGLAGVFVGAYLAAGLVGLVTWRGRIAWKVAGAVTLASVAIFDLATEMFLLDASAATLVDTALGGAVALATIMLAAFYWTHRSATPNPLGGKGPPFSY